MAINRGKEIPDLLANAPELYFGLAIFLDAFWELNHDRDYTFGEMLPIKRRDVRKWLSDRGLDDDDLTISMTYHVLQLDAFYREFMRAKRKSSKSEGVGNGRRERVVQSPRQGVRGRHSESRERDQESRR